MVHNISNHPRHPKRIWKQTLMISILKQKVKSADATQLVDKVFTFVLILAWTALPSLPSLGRCASPLGSNLRLDSAGQQPGDWSGS